MEELRSPLHASSDYIRSRIQERSRDELEAVWPHNTRTLVGPEGNVRAVNCITIPVGNMRPEAETFGNLKDCSINEKLFFRAVNFIIRAMYNPEVGTPYSRAQAMNFPLNGVTTPKWIAKVELLVSCLYEDGSSFIPTPGQPGRPLEIKKLLDPINRAGMRIWYFTRDAGFSPDKAFAALMNQNRERAREAVRSRRPPSSHSRADPDEAAAAQSPACDSRGAPFKGRTLNPDDIKLPPDQLYQWITSPEQFARYVVYPLTGVLLEEDSLRQYTPDYNIGAPRDRNWLWSNKWMTLQGSSQLLMRSREEQTERRRAQPDVPAVCAAQLLEACYWRRDPESDCLEALFPCDDLVWEYKPTNFSWDYLARQQLPFSISLLDLMMDCILKAREEDSGRSRHRAVLPQGLDSLPLPDPLQVQALLRDCQDLQDMRLHANKPSESLSYGGISTASALRSGLYGSGIASSDWDALRNEGGDLRVMFEVATPKKKLVQMLRWLYPELYPTLLRLLQHEGLQHYMSFASPEADISPAMKHILQWKAAQDPRSFFPEVLSADPSQGRFINRITYDLVCLDALLALRDQHKIILEALASVNRNKHYWRANLRDGQVDLNIWLALFSGPGAGKSMIANIIKLLSIPGIVSKVSSTTNLAHTGERYQHDQLVISDEPQTSTVVDSRKLNTQEQQSIEWRKSQITGHELTHRALVMDKDPSGRTIRRTETLTTEFGNSGVMCGNELSANADAALYDRIRVHTMDIKHFMGKDVVSLNSSSLDRESERSKESFIHYVRVLQYLHTVAAKMQVSAALPACNIELITIYYNNLLRYLAVDDPHVVAKVRVSDKMRSRAMEQCVSDAIDRLFFSEDSMFWDIDFQGEVQVPKFSESMLLNLGPLLCLREDAAFKIISEHVTELFPPMEWEILNWMARNLCNYVPARPPWLSRADVDSLPTDSRGRRQYRELGDPISTTVSYYQPPTEGSSVVMDTEKLSVKGTIKKIAHRVSTQMTESGSIDFHVVENILERLQRRVVRYRVQEAYLPEGGGDYLHRWTWRKVNAVELVPSLAGGEPQLVLSVVFVERSPEYYQRKVVRSFRHKYLRTQGAALLNPTLDSRGEIQGRPSQRMIPLGVTYPNVPYMLKLVKAKADPDRVIKVPNALFMNASMMSIADRKLRADCRESWGFGASRRQEMLTFNFDIERWTWDRHLEGLAVPQEKWKMYYPETSDSRIWRKYYAHPVYRSLPIVRLPQDLLADVQRTQNTYKNHELAERNTYDSLLPCIQEMAPKSVESESEGKRAAPGSSRQERRRQKRRKAPESPSLPSDSSISSYLAMDENSMDSSNSYTIPACLKDASAKLRANPAMIRLANSGATRL